MSGHRRIFINGLRFPAGDYCEMGNDEQGTNHLIFGEALNYGSPARSGMQMETGVIENPPFTHVWFWKSRLPERKGQPCRVVARGKLNSILVEFEDGFRVVTSRYAVRKCTLHR